jgi:uncharacterized protein (TIGR02266 family)
VAERERRKHERVRARAVAAHVRGIDRSFSCQVENISQGGLFLRTDQLLPRGSFVVLDLVKPGARKALHLEGTVAGAKLSSDGPDANPGMGIELLPMEDELRERFSGLLREMGAPVEPERQPVQPPLPSSARTALPTQKETGTPRSVTPLAVIKVVAPSELKAPRMVAASAAGDLDTSRLMTQIQGLLLELGEAQRQLQQREAELATLREELAQARRDKAPR